MNEAVNEAVNEGMNADGSVNQAVNTNENMNVAATRAVIEGGRRGKRGVDDRCREKKSRMDSWGIIWG